MSCSRSTITQEGQETQAAPAAAPDDAVLVAAAQVNPTAFAPLYARYLPPVYRYCYRRLGTSAAAEDATSEVFVKALAAMPRYRAGSFRSWLFTIAHHVTTDILRRQRPQEPLETADEPMDSAPTPEDVVVAADGHRALLARLPVDQRSIVELRLAGLTDAEVAETLGRSVGAVKSTQFRALARLRHLLTSEAVPGEGNPR